MKNICRTSIGVLLLCFGLSSISKTVSADTDFKPDEPPQHIAWLGYAFTPAALPKYYENTKIGYYNFDFGMKIDSIAAGVGDMYWAHGFNFGTKPGHSGQGLQYGYTGLQIAADGRRKAIFSLWGGSIDPANPHCVQGHELGAVASCIMPYQWETGHQYRFRIWATSGDTSKSKGTWWGVWVMDTTTQQETFIAKIQAPEHFDWMSSASGFVEYWGPIPDKCATKLPYSKATYYNVKAEKDGYTGQISSSIPPASFALCAPDFLRAATCSGGQCVIEVGGN